MASHRVCERRVIGKRTPDLGLAVLFWMSEHCTKSDSTEKPVV